MLHMCKCVREICGGVTRGGVSCGGSQFPFSYLHLVVHCCKFIAESCFTHFLRFQNCASIQTLCSVKPFPTWQHHLNPKESGRFSMRFLILLFFVSPIEKYGVLNRIPMLSNSFGHEFPDVFGNSSKFRRVCCRRFVLMFLLSGFLKI